MLISHKIELRPTKKQSNYLYQACGSRRFAYNQLLAYFSQDGMKWNKKEAQNKIKELRASFDFYKIFQPELLEIQLMILIMHIKSAVKPLPLGMGI